MLRKVSIVILTCTATLAFTAMPSGFGKFGDDGAQAAENHNSSRSNRTNTVAKPGGNNNKGGLGVAVKEEGVKSMPKTQGNKK